MFYGAILGLFVLMGLCLLFFNLSNRTRKLYHYAGTLRIGQRVQLTDGTDALFLALAFKSGADKKDWIVLTNSANVVDEYRAKGSVSYLQVGSLIHMPLSKVIPQ